MAADRPLLVVHDGKEGHLVYDLLLEEEEEEEATLVCFPRPVAHFPFPSDSCAAFAVAGGSILGVRYDFWNDTLFHDTVMQVGGYDFWERQPYIMRDAEGRVVRWWPKTRVLDGPRSYGSYRDMPAMLPMPDGTVIRMDTILFDGIYNWERFRRRDPCGWLVTPLPKPPLGRLAENEVVLISAYFVMGTRVWISASRKGTFSLDTADQHGGAWRVEGTWELPFEGRALYVPELESVVGLAADTRLLCAYGFKSGTTPVMRHVWRETFPWPHEERIGQPAAAAAARDMPSLAYLGKGRFCICRPMSTEEPTLYGTPITYDASSFLVVEVKRLPSGELQLAKRGNMSYMWPPQGRRCKYVGFIQPGLESMLAT